MFANRRICWSRLSRLRPWLGGCARDWCGEGSPGKTGAPMHYLLFYEAAEDYLERRAPFREEHLALAWQAHERGELILGGAFANPIDGAVVLFQGDSPAVAERFALADPY